MLSGIAMHNFGCRWQTGPVSGPFGRRLKEVPPSYQIVDGQLTVPLHILSMPNGRLPVSARSSVATSIVASPLHTTPHAIFQIPAHTTSLYLEIGTNAFNTWDQQPKVC